MRPYGKLALGGACVRQKQRIEFGGRLTPDDPIEGITEMGPR